MNLNEKIEVLSMARQRISKPENFLQHRFHDGNEAYCSLGALQPQQKISQVDWYDLPEDVKEYCVECCIELDRSLPAVTFTDVGNTVTTTHPSHYRVVAYNNNHSHAEVLAMFDTTIKRLKRELVIENLKESRVTLETEGEWKVLESV